MLRSQREHPRRHAQGWHGRLQPPLPGQPDPWSPSDPKFGGFWQGGKHWTEVVGDDTVGFLGEASKSEKPFFMYIAFNAPHDPRQSPKEYVDRYPLDRIQVPENFLPEYPHKDTIGCGPGLRDEKLGPFPRDEHAVKVHRQEYYAIITHLDAQIGRILDALEQSGEAENTWIFFTADHGLAVGHHGLFGKQNLYDHSLRVPFLAAGPGVKAGAKIDAPIYLQSAMATALDLAGADREGIEFESVRPLLEGKDDGLDAVYGAYNELQRAVIDDGWKLILYPKARVARLYHLAEDPQEMRDLAADPAMTAKKRELFARFLELQKEFDDSSTWLRSSRTCVEAVRASHRLRPQGEARRLGHAETGFVHGEVVGLDRKVGAGLVKFVPRLEQVVDRLHRIGGLQQGPVPVAPHPLVDHLGGRPQPDHVSGVAEDPAVFLARHDAAAGGDDLPLPAGTAAEHFGLEAAEGVLALVLEDLRDRLSGLLHDQFVGVDESKSEAAGDALPHRGLPGAMNPIKMRLRARFPVVFTGRSIAPSPLLPTRNPRNPCRPKPSSPTPNQARARR